MALMLHSARVDQRLFDDCRVSLEVPSGIYDILAVRDGAFCPRKGVEMAELE